jgi:hypothetical protein
MGFVVSRVVLVQALAFPCEFSYLQCFMSIRQSSGKWTIGQLKATVSNSIKKLSPGLNNSENYSRFFYENTWFV